MACRTAAAQGAAGVLALAFPLHPPGRPEKSRAGELTAVTVPIVRGAGRDRRDGHARRRSPPRWPGAPNASVYAVPGDHSLKKNVDVVAAAAMSWLVELAGGG